MHTNSPNVNTLLQVNQETSFELLNLLLDLKDHAIFTTDPTGEIISWNGGASYLYGYQKEEVLGKNVSLFYSNHEVQKGLPGSYLQKAKANGRFEHEEWKIKKDGSSFYANTITAALFNSDGSIKGFAKVTRDITQKRKLIEENEMLSDQLEEKVKQRTKELEIVNKELEAFSYSVSHDLRAPLRAVSGYSMILKEDYESKLDAEGIRLINVIVDNTKMMSELIDDLLTFSKMSRLEMVSSAIDMKELAERCFVELLQSTEKKDYDFTVDTIPQCTGDANMLKQVWTNLIGNALKYSSKKAFPSIKIGSKEDKQNYLYYIQDNGSGFDMKYSNKLFGVFQRLHRQDEFEGTGLGLALAKRIITKHGGQIWAEATLNKGATFYFSIPKIIS